MKMFEMQINNKNSNKDSIPNICVHSTHPYLVHILTLSSLNY